MLRTFQLCFSTGPKESSGTVLKTQIHFITISMTEQSEHILHHQQYKVEGDFREQIFAGSAEPKKYSSDRENSIFQLSPHLSRQLQEWGRGNHVQLILNPAGDYSPVCTPVGKGKLKGQ